MIRRVWECSECGDTYDLPLQACPVEGCEGHKRSETECCKGCLKCSLCDKWVSFKEHDGHFLCMECNKKLSR